MLDKFIQTIDVLTLRATAELLHKGAQLRHLILTSGLTLQHNAKNFIPCWCAIVCHGSCREHLYLTHDLELALHILLLRNSLPRALHEIWKRWI